MNRFEVRGKFNSRSKTFLLPWNKSEGTRISALTTDLKMKLILVAVTRHKYYTAKFKIYFRLFKVVLLLCRLLSDFLVV